MRNISYKNQNKHFVFNKFFSENRAIYKMMCKIR